MNRIWILSIFWLGIGTSALAAGCPADVTTRFPAAQSRVLCGEEAPDYSGTNLGYLPQGRTCITKMGSCPLNIGGPQGAPCECSLEEGRVPGFIQK